MNKKIYTIDSSYTIILQENILKDAGMNIGDDVNCYIENGQIILKKPHKQSFQSCWKNFVGKDGTYDEKEDDFGEPVGRELW